MHVDEKKRYDKRTIDRNLRQGVVSRREYEEHLARLPDVSDKIFVWGEEDNQGKGKDRKKSDLDRAPAQRPHDKKGKKKERSL